MEDIILEIERKGETKQRYEEQFKKKSEEGTEVERVLGKWQSLKNIVRMTAEEMLVKNMRNTRKGWFNEKFRNERENRQKA